MFAGLGRGGEVVQFQAQPDILCSSWGGRWGGGRCPAPALSPRLPACPSGGVPVAHLPAQLRGPSGRGTGTCRSARCNARGGLLFLRGVEFTC